MEKENSRGSEPARGDLTEQAAQFARRRQVIKGLSTVPVVATLSSGFSAAAASILGCASTGEIPANQVVVDLNNLDQAEWEEIDPAIPGCNNPDAIYDTYFNRISRYYYHNDTSQGGPNDPPIAEGTVLTITTYNVDSMGEIADCSDPTPLLASCHTSLIVTMTE